ncbi:MAG TPA: hypothetical protein VHE83_00780 [Mycobacteriales bacterium]|nr:hypothetical protein [Mycobacteriales bacterium]
MSLKRELTDPWTPVVGGLAGGLAWAVGIAFPPAIAIGAAVAGVKIAAGALTRDKKPKDDDADPVLPIVPGSAAADLFARCQRAASSYASLVRSLPPTVASSADGVAGGIDDTIAQLRVLAGRACAVDGVLVQLGGPGAASEPQSAREREAVEERTAAITRVRAVRDQLLAQMRSAATDLEELVARVGEVLAEVTAGGVGARAGIDDRLDDLAGRLEGLRQGLATTEQLTRQNLGAAGTTGRMMG